MISRNVAKITTFQVHELEQLQTLPELVSRNDRTRNKINQPSFGERNKKPTFFSRPRIVFHVGIPSIRSHNLLRSSNNRVSAAGGPNESAQDCTRQISAQGNVQ